MRRIMTVTGPVEAAETGICVVGERLVATLPVPRPKRATDSWFYEQPVTMPLLGDRMTGRANRDDATLQAEHARIELERFAQAGGGLVVDVTTPAEGRDLDVLRGLSEATGVRIVAAAAASEDTAAVEREVRDGSCGLIVVPAQTPDVVRAATYALAAWIGAPVLIDAGAEDPVMLVIEALQSGLRPEQLAVRPAAVGDPEAMRRLTAAGVHLLFDGLGRIPTVHTRVSDHEVAVAIAARAASGSAHRMLLGADLARKHAFTAFGGNGLAFIPAQFLPYLRMLGLDEEAAARLATLNVHEFLAGAQVHA